MSDKERVLFAAINSKFIHTNTAVYYLHRILTRDGFLSSVASFTINDDKHEILGRIVSAEPDVLCISCYIWNIPLVYELCNDIKNIAPEIKIILGGPEVTYEPGEALKQSGADLIIRGEGEEVISRAVKAVLSGELSDIKGFCYKNDNKIADNGVAVTSDLSTVPSPFTDSMLNREKGKLIYYEASRGCPYNCIYCLSSADNGVRYFPLSRVYDDIEKIIQYKPGTVKFTDRSFNINSERTNSILEFLKSIKTDICFHLEIYPSGLAPETMLMLESMPAGRIQVEAGIQSTNERTLEMSGRKQDVELALKNMKRLIASGNMHTHLDLIAGLPGEDIKLFEESFNMTMDVRPHVLQVGFLKLLKGTAARRLEGYKSEAGPPYEVFSTPWISFREICVIKKVEKCVDMFYNTGKFKEYFNYMHSRYSSSFSLYKNLADYIENSGKNLKGISRTSKYETLAQFGKKDKKALEHLRFDFMSSYKSRVIPEFLGVGGFDSGEIFDLLHNEEFRLKYLPQYAKLNSKQLFKKVNLGRFDFGSGPENHLFVYDGINPVTGLFNSILVNN